MDEYGDNLKKKVYEVEVVKVLTYIVKVTAWSMKEAADKAVIDVEKLGISDANDESIEPTDINEYDDRDGDDEE